MFKFYTSLEIKIIILSCAGGALEFFEFTIYALFAQFIGSNIFPTTNKFNSLLLTLGIYAVGYLARPIGGAVFGYIGDKYGRKKAFSITVIIMSLATLGIGCLPNYNSIGLISSIMLLFFRILQGFSVGGEVPGATTFTTEHVAIKKRGLSVGIIFTGITLGNLIASLMGFTLTHFISHEHMMKWGWRLPFIFGFFLGFLSFMIRKKTSETPIFQRLTQEKMLHKNPVAFILKYSKKLLLLGFCLMSIPSALLSYFLFFPVYLSTFFNFDLTKAYLINIIGFSVLTIGTLVSGYISNYCDRKKLALIGCAILLLVGYVASYKFLENNLSSLVMYIALLTASTSIINGCYGLLITEIFPTGIRYTGLGISFSLGVAVFGGLGPFIVAFLTKNMHSMQAPYYYFVFCILITAAALFYLIKPPILENEYIITVD